MVKISQILPISQIEKLKIKLGISAEDTGQDDLLQLYLDDAEDFILNLTHIRKIPDELLSIQIDLAIVYFNKNGIEGQIAHSEGGINRTFEDIPKSTLKRLSSYRKLPR